MEIKRCCFAGHSSIIEKEDIVRKIEEKAEALIKEENVTEFMVGNYGDFDHAAAKAVRNLKKKYPQIRLTLVVPYMTKELSNPELTAGKYDDILIAEIPLSTPRNLKIIKANHYMVNNSQYMICFIKYSWGGAAMTLEYAEKRKHIIIYNISD